MRGQLKSRRITVVRCPNSHDTRLSVFRPRESTRQRKDKLPSDLKGKIQAFRCLRISRRTSLLEFHIRDIAAGNLAIRLVGERRVHVGNRSSQTMAARRDAARTLPQLRERRGVTKKLFAEVRGPPSISCDEMRSPKQSLQWANACADNGLPDVQRLPVVLTKLPVETISKRLANSVSIRIQHQRCIQMPIKFVCLVCL